MDRNNETIRLAKKAADAWSSTDTYHQAAQIIDMLISALEGDPTLTPPNDPLTLEELREMDGEPVWVVYDQDAAKTTPGFDPLALWALVEVGKNAVRLTNKFGGRTAYANDQELEWAGITVCRRPPEGEEDT